MKKKLLIIDVLLILVSLGLLVISHYSTSFCDVYVKRIYVIWVGTIGRITGLLPFSLAEILMYLTCVVVVIELIWLTIHRFNKTTNVLTGYLTFATILLFLYTMNCGINYGHSSYSEQKGMSLDTYDTNKLAQMCQYLTDKINELAPEQTRDENGVMIETNIPTKAQNTMNKIGQTDELLSGYYPKPKELINSSFLSVQQLSGIYVPFTIESNYNRDMPDFQQTFTSCHELSHMRGYMQEEEANYLAFLACINSDYISFQYGGYLEGWIYATNELYARSPKEWEKIKNQLCNEVCIDLVNNDEFWTEYEGSIAEFSEQVNDNYLKANGQQDGTLSYDRMVSLMMEWFSEK